MTNTTGTGTTTTTTTTTTTGAGTGTNSAPRADLLALSEDSLAALANRGLVKRAVKESAAGAGARIGVVDGGELTAEYPDGTVARLRADSPLTDATCSCAAAGLCRHRIGLVLAYQGRYAGSPAAPAAPAESAEPASGPAAESAPESATKPAAEAEPVSTPVPAPAPATPRSPSARWSPGEITDEILERALGSRPVREARRNLAAGYRATVHRPGSASRNPAVELPTCTVVFHIPGDPAYATTDAVEQKRGEAVAMAVWAFRAADAQGLDGDKAQVNVGGGSPGTSSSHASSKSSSPSRPDVAETLLAHAAELVESLLSEGVSACGRLLVGNLRRSARDLAAASLLWPAAVLDALVEQLDWYLERNARYELARLADLATEFLARRRAAAAFPTAAGRASVSPAQVLGTGESARTQLRRIRLIGLGCRILGGPRHRTAELYFAHPHDGTVLVLRREWRFEETEQAPTGRQLRSRTVAGSPLHMLAACNLVSEAASRSASRVVELGISRLAKTTVTAVGEAWKSLPDNVGIRDYAALATALGDREPRYLRPRVEAEDVYVLTVDEVEWVGYDPAAQCLEASVRDARGTRARVRSPYRSASPAALDALNAALTDGGTAVPSRSSLMLSGSVTVQAGELVVDPIAVWNTGAGTGRPIVPDLAEGDDSADLPAASHPRSGHDTSADSLRGAADILAEHAHRGIGRVGPAGVTAVEQAAASLSRLGFKALGALLTAYHEALLADGDPEARLRSWADASTALTVCREAGA